MGPFKAAAGRYRPGPPLLVVWILALALALALVFVFLASAPPSRADARPIRLVAIGDFGVGGRTQLEYGRAVERFAAARNVSMLLTLGDNDYSRAAAFQENWQASFGWLGAARIPISGALGNHDVEETDGSHEFDALNMPGRFYTRTVGPVAIFVLDSNDVSRQQTNWLRRALRRSDARWKIVTMHHPAYTCGGHKSDEAVQTHWVPMFEEYGVQLVLAGHDHNYQRFRARNGVNYVVHGGGGRKPYALRECGAEAPELLRGRVVVGFLTIVAREGGLIVKAINLRGRQIDRLVIRP